MSENAHLIAITDVFSEAEKLQLFAKLVTQCQKDIFRAGIDYEIPEQLNPEQFFGVIKELLRDLMNYDFSSFLNLLYAVDVSEKKIKAFSSIVVDDIAVYASFLLIEREWQKIRGMYYLNR
ncbi:hypothetical protein ACFSTE_07305 [Aquimarina hainanensis]|uniref:Uncharacterized protein n=1 Tax=Aquimarina hainanensis TaxID=1578017 RepID=A0ABW5N6H6_9FLAO